MVSSFETTSFNAEEIQSGLERVLNSGTFRKNPSLRHLLQYLVTSTVAGRTDQIKESIIAIEVFSRRDDFDGRIDNIVRVQAHRLRKLLEVYYGEEGRNEKLRFSVPKGSYVPQLEFGEPEGASVKLTVPESPAGATPVANQEQNLVLQPASPSALTALPPPPKQLSARFGLGLAFLSGILAASLIFPGLLRLPAVFSLINSPRPVDPAVSEIWRGIFAPGAKVIAAYSDPAFLRVGSSPVFLLYKGPLTAPPGAEIDPGPMDRYIDRQFVPKGQPLRFSDGWTGTGEVLAVNRLTVLSLQFGKPLNLAPSRAVGLNDMHAANVIFLGSPWGKGALPETGSATAPLWSKDGRISSRDSDPRLAVSYANVKNEITKETVAGFALFSVLPGMDAGRFVVSSAGLGTCATWAGIDFVTTPAGAAQLARALKAANAGTLPRYYQAVIRADIIKGAASNPSLVTVRIVPGKG